MELQTNKEDKFYIISVIGDLDAVSASSLNEELDRAFQEDEKNILIDCQQLEYIASAGIGVFTSRIEECAERGIKIILYAVSQKIVNVFKILGLDVILPIVTNKEDAKQFANKAG